MTHDLLWQTKLHARLHDPAEKALVLLRDPAGHEGGTSKVLWRMARTTEVPAEDAIDNDNAEVLHAVAFEHGIKPATYCAVRRADWWAAAADRPQWPLREINVTTKQGDERTLAIADFAQVRWTQKPVLKHPLSGAEYDLGKHGGLGETDFTDIKQRSFNHFSHLLVRDNGETDFKKSLLAFWRFGPDVREDEDNGKIGELWRLLPADTRIPDHSIWDHLDLTSAFAGAFAADPDGEAALLTLAIGPVQSFIAAARSTSDLWAGSHLLSRLAWEAMKPLCERLGPDAILFPRLRAVPQVDLWLRDECGLDPALFKDCDWANQRTATDANPLFSAALPNRFVAVVPASQATKIAQEVEKTVRDWLRAKGKEVVDRLLDAAQLHGDYCYQQMEQQLAGFPEVHWAAVPFSLIKCRDEKKQRDLDVTALSDAMRPFFEGEGKPGFLGSAAWKVLCKETKWADNTTFFDPNPGVLYPAVHELAERVLAASKVLRPFAQTKQEGWRDSLTGESEWLMTDPEQRFWNQNYRRQQGTLWTALEGRFGIKGGEHLGALSALKRLWPTLFAEEVGKALGNSASAQRFVVSTHTMAIAAALDGWIEKGERIPTELAEELKKHDRVALPRKLVLDAREHQNDQVDLLARIPGWLDEARDAKDETELGRAEKRINALLGQKPDSYYAMILMDGDHMGAWLSGEHAISYLDSFHPQVREGFLKHIEREPALQKYAQQKRALSPNRHLAISGALNDFALTVVRHVVEKEYLGRLLYAGGDDVLAMLPVPDLLPCMRRLRAAYSGHDATQSTNFRGQDKDVEQTIESGSENKRELRLQNGFALLKTGNRRTLMCMMGTTASASVGAVIAHHQTPLSAVLRELHSAEHTAKETGGRDAFSLTVLKRSGGALYLTQKWTAPAPRLAPMQLLQDLSEAFAKDGASRRAAYNTALWTRDLPEVSQLGEAAYREMLGALLHQQFTRQKLETKDKPELSMALANAAPLDKPAKDIAAFIENELSVAEFLARDVRA